MDLGSIFSMAAYGSVGILALTTLASGLFTSPQKHDTLITRFGKHIRTVENPGLNWKIPFIDKIHDKVSKQFGEFAVKDDDGEDGLQIKTSDNLVVRLPVKIQGWIEDTAKYTFDNENPDTVISSRVRREVRGFASGKTLDELYKQDKDDVGAKVTGELHQAILDRTGFYIDNVVIDEPAMPISLQKSYNEVREAENRKKAKVADAQGDKEAQIEAGKGVAGFRKEVFDGYAAQITELQAAGIPEAAAAEMVMETMRMDTLRDIGDKRNMVIVTEGRGQDSGEFADFLAKNKALEPALRKGAQPPAGEQDNGRQVADAPAAAAPAPGPA